MEHFFRFRFPKSRKANFKSYNCAHFQAFYICQVDGRQDDFICPNGTIFNQELFVCDWWYNFDCSTTEEFTHLNEFIYDILRDKYQNKH